MHTVNKAYTILKQEGYLRVDRRRGTFIAIDADDVKTLIKVKEELRKTIARCRSRSITKAQIHALIEEIYEDYD
jgi:DNA-binding transcriptional regulator YhcF (GntR family)